MKFWDDNTKITHILKGVVYIYIYSLNIYKYKPDELTVRFSGVLINWLLVNLAIPWRPAANDATWGKFCKLAKFWWFKRVTMSATVIRTFFFFHSIKNKIYFRIC